MNEWFFTDEDGVNYVVFIIRLKAEGAPRPVRERMSEREREELSDASNQA